MKFFIILTLFVLTTSAQLNTKCETPNKKTGICIEYSNCFELRKLARDLSKRQYVRDSQCGYLIEALVCCPNPLIEEVGGDDFCHNIESPDKITGGKNTTIGEFPWMAQLQYKFNRKDKNATLCAGSIINKRFILTAAHCFDIPDYTLQFVILGEWDTRSNPDIVNEIEADPIQTHKVKAWIKHEEYNISTEFENDIGLVQVSNEIVYSDWIKPICIPNSASLRTRDMQGEELTVSGWGRTSGRQYANVSPVKLKAVLSGTSKQYCQTAYTEGIKYTKHDPIVISDKQICAFEAGKDACRGDSGGPIMAKDYVNHKVYMYLVGIVSFGPARCGGPTIPGVYTKVAAYISWIKDNLE